MNSILPVNLTDSEEKKAGGWARRANRNIFSGWAGSERHSSTSCSEWCRVLIRWATCEVIQRKICSVSTRLPLYSLSMTLPFDAEVWGTDMIRVERCQPRLMHDLAHRRHNQQWSTAGQIYMQFHLLSFMAPYKATAAPQHTSAVIQYVVVVLLCGRGCVSEHVVDCIQSL